MLHVDFTGSWLIYGLFCSGLFISWLIFLTDNRFFSIVLQQKILNDWTTGYSDEEKKAMPLLWLWKHCKRVIA